MGGFGHMRLRVVHGSSRIFVVVGEDTQTKSVRELCSEIGSSLGKQSGEEVRVHSLEIDNFKLPLDAQVNQILRDDDVVQVLDRANYFRQQYQLCQTCKHSFAREDWNDESYHKILIGYQENNLIYLAYLVSGDLKDLYLMSKMTIKGLEIGQEVQLFESSHTADCDGGSKQSEIKVSAKRLSEYDYQLVLSFQVTSDPRPQIRVVALTLGSTLKIGDETIIQEPFVDWLAKEIPVTLPEGKETGQGLPDVIESPTVTAGAYEEEVKGLGLTITQQPINGKNQVLVNQGYASGDNIDVIYNASFLVVNSADKVCNIPKISAEYQDGSQWIAFDKTTLVGSGNAYTSFPPNSTTSIELGAILLNQNGPMTSHRRRTPPTLPQPMVIRFTFKQQDDEEVSITVQQVNDAMELATQSDEDVFWMCCDHSATLDRYTFRVRFDKEYYQIYYQSNSSIGYYPSTFQKIAWKAKKEGKSEYRLDNLSYDSDSYRINSQNVYALVDLEKMYVYALKVEMSCPGHSRCGYFAIPPLPTAE